MRDGPALAAEPGSGGGPARRRPEKPAGDIARSVVPPGLVRSPDDEPGAIRSHRLERHRAVRACPGLEVRRHVRKPSAVDGATQGKADQRVARHTGAGTGIAAGTAYTASTAST